MKKLRWTVSVVEDLPPGHSLFGSDDLRATGKDPAEALASLTVMLNRRAAQTGVLLDLADHEAALLRNVGASS